MKTYPKAWIDALRSGKYQQCRGALIQDGSRFCCLGVLCEISEIQRRIFSGWCLLQSEFLCGMATGSGDLPIVCRDGLYTSLSDLNDSGKLTFPQIADVIECFWEVL